MRDPAILSVRLRGEPDPLAPTPRPGGTAPASTHVHFDWTDVVRVHVCDYHRAEGDRQDCCDGGALGDCPHVQYRPCTCPTPRPCKGCEVATAIAEQMPEAVR